jgi:hypothetical protein
VGVLKTLAFLIAAAGMAVVESVRSVPANDDDDVGLFIGSARPLAARIPVHRPRR